ncbi:MAG TPA: leucyl/phenylalanyl-tRNA--protein transferase, partial [Allosphingosinicella sp.]
AYQVTLDRAFTEIVRLCAMREETWINAGIEAGYVRLHEAGRAHSVEIWQDGELAGGLYGVRLGAAFFGESMVSLRPSASKVALAWLVARLIVGGFRLLDCQFITPHLKSLGAVEIDQKDYLALLDSALGGGGEAAGAASAGPVEFEALDRLLAARPEGAGVPPAGCVIAQLLGQTS